MSQPRMAGLKRINDHRREILKIWQTSQNIAFDPNKEKRMWAYERLTHKACRGGPRKGPSIL